MAAAGASSLIHAGGLIDGVSDHRSAAMDVRVVEGRIDDVGPRLSLPAGGTEIDLRHSTLLPGFIDLHAHILSRPLGELLTPFLTESSATKTLYGLRRAQQFLQSGFTTLRNPGDVDAHFGLVSLRDAISRGEFVGPRLFVAPHYLTATGGHADLNQLAPDLLTLAAGRVVSGPESIREVIRNEIKYGADWIKLYVSGGVMSLHDDPRTQTLTDEEIRSAVDETHRLKRLITVHAHGTEAIRSALQAGVDSVEHGTLVDEEGIRLLRERDVALVPTVYVLDYIAREGARLGIPEPSVAKACALIEERNRRLRAAVEAGVRIAVGSDTIFSVEHAAREFSALTGIGLSPIASIRAGTSEAARVLGLSDEIGRIAPGWTADLVAVEGDPSTDLRRMEAVHFVMQGGRAVRHDRAGARQVP